MNKQMERDLKRRKAEEEREQKRREHSAKMPEYKGIKPRARIFYPIVVGYVKVKDFINKLLYWSEERGEKFLSRYWKKAACLFEEEEFYCLYISKFYLYNWKVVVKNPIIKAWASQNKKQINEFLLSSNWTPSGYYKIVIRSTESWKNYDYVEFRPI